MNMREFAKLCGVAHSTVSRVLNRPLADAQVSKETYDRIRAKAAEVGFKVNYYAQIFHSRNSNCFGFITGNRVHMLAETLLYGVSQSLNPENKNLSIHLCDDMQEVEAAFEKMVLYNADAVFYVPPIQKGKNYSSRYMDKIMKKYSHFPPVVVLYGGAGTPRFYQIRLHDYEIGRQAALRQLNRGCRNFVILCSLYSYMMNREMGRGYRETLLENGVPSKKIKELFFWPDGNENYAKMRGADGMLCSHFLVLLHSAPVFLPHVDPAKLHVDCPCGTEMENTHRLFSPAGTFKKNDIRCIFGSVMIHQYKIQDIGAKGTEVALQLSRNGGDAVPPITYIDSAPVLFHAK